MPRVFASNNDPLDFCKTCFPDEDEAENAYGDVNLTGHGPDGRGNCFAYDAEHPPYELENYRCLTCRKPLKEEDN